MLQQANDFNEQEVSIESIMQLRIKAMENERKALDCQAKMKKMQFKTSRDLKEMKMLEEKAKSQLKDQKQKSDKLAKTVSQITQQNNILHHHIVELKAEKVKQVQSIITQYNHLKAEVRNYERILPTLTFMNKIGADYEKLPTYQEVFMNWKERSERCDDIENKFKAYKAETGEKMEMQEKVYENLNKKKLQIEKQLRDDITKMLELETQIATLSLERDQWKAQCQQIVDELNSAKEKNSQLSEDIRNLKIKLEQIVKVYQTQLEMKEEQLQKLSAEESKRHEQEIEQITRAFEAKQNSHLQQLAFFEEEEQRWQQKSRKEKEKFEENYQQMRSEVERIKNELEVEKELTEKHLKEDKKLKQVFAQKSNQCSEYLKKLGEYQLKIQELERQIKEYDKKLVNQQGLNAKQDDNIDKERKYFEQKITQYQDKIKELKEDLNEKQNQINILNNEIEEIKNKNGLFEQQTNFPVTSHYEGQPKSTIRNRSVTEDKNQNQKVTTISCQQVQYREMKSPTSTVSQPGDRRKASSDFYTQQQLDSKIKQAVKEYQLEMQRKISEIKLENERQLRIIYEQELNDKIVQHKKWLDQIEKRYSQVNQKYQMLKAQKDKLEQNYKNEAKKDKENINIFKNQNRQLQKTLKDYQKSIQILNAQIEALKKSQQKMESKEEKEKQTNKESNSTQIKEITEKYMIQINNLMQEKEKQIQLNCEKQEVISSLKQNIEEKIKKIEDLQADIYLKTKQNEILQEQLNHERNDRTLREAPSLPKLPYNEKQLQEMNFKEFYNQSGQKQGKIALLEREVNDLKQQIKQLNLKHDQKVASLEIQMQIYIEQIITMKLKVANAEMKASQKVYLYNQLKKKMNII